MLCLDVVFRSLEELKLELSSNWRKTEALTADPREDQEDTVVADGSIIAKDRCLGASQSDEIKGAYFQDDG